MKAYDFVHDLAPLLAATRARPWAIVLANPQPPVGSVVDIAANGAPETGHRFDVVGHGTLPSPGGDIACSLLVPTEARS